METADNTACARFGAALDPSLRTATCTRSVWNRSAVIYHLTLANLDVQLPPKVLFAACMSYASKECCDSTGLTSLIDFRKGVDDVEVAAVETLIFEYVRPHVVLIESCVRSELKVLTLNVATLNTDRDSTARIALALAQGLYETPLCLSPESCARACLLAACDRLQHNIDLDCLPPGYCDATTRCILTHLLSA